VSHPDSVAAPSIRRGLPRGTKWFLAALVGIALLYGALITYHVSTPRKTVVSETDWLDRCRETCLTYGLIPTGNVRKDAEAYLAAVRKQPLTEAMITILDDRAYAAAPSQEHPLVGKPAPNFTLPDHLGQSHSLDSLRDHGPIVVVFYYGYGCSHCVAQLIGLDQELDYFRQLGARVVAISSDSPAHTREKYLEYGEFHFPVLADEQNSVATLYGTFTPETAEKMESRDHGTFVIDRQGLVRWAHTGPSPFLDNKSLLLTLADVEGLRPALAKPTASNPAKAQ
jgi:thioredoxin-dependent peroxiredoxin